LEGSSNGISRGGKSTDLAHEHPTRATQAAWQIPGNTMNLKASRGVATGFRWRGRERRGPQGAPIADVVCEVEEIRERKKKVFLGA